MSDDWDTETETMTGERKAGEEAQMDNLGRGTDFRCGSIDCISLFNYRFQILRAAERLFCMLPFNSNVSLNCISYSSYFT